MPLRPILFLIGLFSALFLTPWVTLVCAVLLAMRYHAWEVLVLGVVVDLVWLPGVSGVASIPFATLLAAALVWVLYPLRRELLFSA
ncbi:hypothetical protein COU20_00180 [Candidatus Kaiserbacteria bacterium CG10_big_fil_rev_8_21_14_0_10_59_10]|uniref:Rod shape-determining protein MreD n=1 Tax=Candidatus Kaiserbacteria bacterium CG10_big_fil_rev_8_21_14_0_10_59_10 TaxID=1974612 RepID=A0A2H0U8V9_9BACT|nr:MAG: hypothetical protein COU20_00180 [Candidatus Kaiserbacteria bacterium CG10_big_fil_rev_8_21_14_0_10_59_10]